jgi:flagellar hook-associated protein 1 FlgK
MAGLISSLHNSSAALRVHSKGLEVTGKNLANVNNRGYSKERVEIGDRGQINTGVATESMGVEAMGLRQNRDALLDKGVMRELTATADLEARQKVLQSAEVALGQFLDRTKDSTSIQNASGANGGGISDAITDFFNAWESVSVKPNDVGEKQLLIEKAKILAEKINLTDKRLAGVQSDVDSQIQVDVGVVNQLLKEIAENIVNHYTERSSVINGKAMIVSMSRDICVHLYDEIINEFLNENNQIKMLSLINWNELFEIIKNGIYSLFLCYLSYFKKFFNCIF